jgi:hypothetical protein
MLYYCVDSYCILLLHFTAAFTAAFTAECAMWVVVIEKEYFYYCVPEWQ